MTHSKLLILAFAITAVLSLAINIVLFVRLSGSRAEVKYWTRAYEGLARRVQEIEEQKGKTPISVQGQTKLTPKSEPLTDPPSEVTLSDTGNTEDSPILVEHSSGILAAVVEEKFPELGLSEENLVELDGILNSIRESLHAMRNLRRTRANAEAIEKARSHLAQDLQAFENMTGMKPAEFIRRARLAPGIDSEESDDGEIVTEYLRDIKP
ncbi:MAG: hypothetical protein GTN81_00440 [Proteobacteria bacterium]|nr:hypothetical protein [Pseudomonadota bacterium]